MNNDYKVSVIVPCYNVEKYVQKCIDSLLVQTYNNIEIIFIDNESTDQTYEIISKNKNIISDKAENIYKYCWDEPREKGLQIATGDYLIVMGSDDYVERDFILNYVNIFKKSNKKIKALQSPIIGINENNMKVGKTSYSYKTLEELKQNLITSCVVNTPTVMVERSLYDDGLLQTKPEKYSGAADYDLWCNLTDNNIMIYSSPMWLGYYYRWHGNQATWGMQKDFPNISKEIQNYWKDKWKI
jgi:glycosyltransferase involved in cell wall biosynthesis